MWICHVNALSNKYGRCLNLLSVPYSLYHSLTTSPGEKTFEVKIISPGEHLTRIWLQVLDRKDGSFLVRYRMYSTYPDIHIHVLLKNVHVANSPFIVEGSRKHHIPTKHVLKRNFHSHFFFVFSQAQFITRVVTVPSPAVLFGRPTWAVLTLSPR